MGDRITQNGANMKKNDVLELKIHDINNLGMGVAKAPCGMTVFVGGAVDGDTVIAKIIKVASDYCVARVEQIIEPSIHRIESDCPISKRCGGCVYRNITYEHEKELKQAYVRNVFKKAGVKDAIVMSVLSAGEQGYRNKVQYPFSKELDVGFYASHTHTVISGAHDCKLQNPAFEPIIDTVVEFVKDKKLTAYDESTGRGLLRHLFLRIGEKTGQIMVMLVINGEKLPFADEFCKILTKKHENIVSVMINVNKSRSNVILSRDVRVLWGKDHIEDELCGVRLKISALSFYQVNRAAAELLYRRAAELAGLKDGDRLLDLFCGVGSVGLSMKNIAKNETYANISLKGVEIIEDAVKAARENANLSGLEGEFVCSDANGEALDNCDIVVLDPPRKGVEKRLIQQLADKNINRIVYISCGPDTLARDCKAFLELGYSMSEVYLYDLFPRTGHVESVVCLTRRLDN